MERTPEEWRRLFPVMETKMRVQDLTIIFATDQARLEATLPKEFVNSLFSEWQRLQNGAAPDETVFSRHYTGDWNEAKGN